MNKELRRKLIAELNQAKSKLESIHDKIFELEMAIPDYQAKIIMLQEELIEASAFDSVPLEEPLPAPPKTGAPPKVAKKAAVKKTATPAKTAKKTAVRKPASQTGISDAIVAFCATPKSRREIVNALTPKFKEMSIDKTLHKLRTNLKPRLQRIESGANKGKYRAVKPSASSKSKR